MSASSWNDLEKKNVFLTLQVSVSPRGPGCTFPNKHMSSLSLCDGWNVKERAVQVFKSVTASFFEHQDKIGPECLKKVGLARCFTPYLRPSFAPGVCYSLPHHIHLLKNTTELGSADIWMVCSLIEVLYECIQYVKQISGWKWQMLKYIYIYITWVLTSAIQLLFEHDSHVMSQVDKSQQKVNVRRSLFFFF